MNIRLFYFLHSYNQYHFYLWSGGQQAPEFIAKKLSLSILYLFKHKHDNIVLFCEL